MDRLFHRLRHDGALQAPAELRMIYQDDSLRGLDGKFTQARETRKLHKRRKPPFHLELRNHELTQLLIGFYDVYTEDCGVLPFRYVYLYKAS